MEPFVFNRQHLFVESIMMESQFPAPLLSRIENCGVISVLIIEELQDAVPIAKALLAGGVDAMELTLRTPVALDALRSIRSEVPEMLAGIGTILRPQQIHDVIEAGAAFGVAPGMNPAVVSEAQQAELPFAPGIATPSDIEIALSYGCKELKFFPAEPSGGLPYLTSMAAPYQHLGVRFVPLGGVNAENFGSYLKDPSILAVGGSWLAPAAAISEKRWDIITDLAKAATAQAGSVRQGTNC